MATPTLASLLRADQAYYAQISRTRSLDKGIAFTSDAFPVVAEANQFREVWVDPADDLSAVFAAVDTNFGKLGLSCQLWAPSADGSTEGLEPFLLDRGFSRRNITAMALRSHTATLIGEAIRVLPARAMRKALRLIHEAEYKGLEASEREMFIEAALERLNDHRLDEFVALRTGEPAGRCALFQIGDVGRVCGLFVLPAHRRCGVGQALLSQSLKLARRLQLRLVCVPVLSDNEAALGLLQRCGFERDGMTREYAAQGARLFQP